MKYINLNLTKQSKLIFNSPGDYIVYFENLSGDLVFDIKSSGVNLNIYGLYTGSKNSIYKVNTFQNHLEPSSTSDLLIKGVFYDASKFYYRGLIRLEKNAQKSHAYQKNQNILMSKNCYVDSKPYLEILANDVFCTHGSTTGKLNQDQLHYTMTRGLSRKASEDLLITGFINEIKQKILPKAQSI
ncbi:MAG: FeS assembly protein SufD [Candidatus Roizmanbacteria bacterium GW2011_GWA2_35_19]|uniref:FeS assembly protein SufD n=2 Tax=Candidatus Roizmaniibacteriota TaxID=1752723 RepID=A0A0G0F4N7_9BACT|nr:MAG: FeS assembly protein SufD [Candidatus Roizmanbacteria bacterium GW2011_GWC2_35_12]KKP74457.1 MAG: FeS assembly protein SufD [Candidatus Roizmanbacteria bacterium GW2011_GWA2_35_19]